MIKRHSYPRNAGFGARTPRSPRTARPRSHPPEAPGVESGNPRTQAAQNLAPRFNSPGAELVLSARALMPPDTSLYPGRRDPPRTPFVSRETPLFQPNSTPRRPFRPSSPIKQPQTPRKAAEETAEEAVEEVAEDVANAGLFKECRFTHEKPPAPSSCLFHVKHSPLLRKKPPMARARRTAEPRWPKTAAQSANTETFSNAKRR